MRLPYLTKQSDGSVMFQKDVGTLGRYLRATFHPKFPTSFRFVIEGGRGKTVCEYPFVLPSGALRWEWPERVPKYAKKLADDFYHDVTRLDPCA